MSDKQAFQFQPETVESAKAAINLANDALDPHSTSASADVLNLQCNFSKMSLGEVQTMIRYIDLGHLNDSTHVPVAEPEYQNGKLTAVVFDHHVDADEAVRIALQDGSACSKLHDLNKISKP